MLQTFVDHCRELRDLVLDNAIFWQDDEWIVSDNYEYDRLIEQDTRPLRSRKG